MQKLFAALVGIASFAIVAPSFAADLPPAPTVPYKAPVVAPVLMFNWTGFYIGGNVGYGSGNWSDSASLTAFPGLGSFDLGQSNVGGVVAGGQAGANWQISMLVLGIEADYDWSGQKNNTTFTTPVGSIGVNDRISSLGTVRGRLGVAFDRVLLYGTGGWAWGTWHSDVTVPAIVAPPGFAATAGTSSLTSGWTAGGGVEFAFVNNWTAKFEYLYVDTGSKIDTTAIPGVTLTDRLKDNVFRFGINYLFNAGPVVARY